ncbi:MAG: hypothetical protein ACJAS1_005616, partial [Oleiphilaceae bacterium]
AGDNVLLNGGSLESNGDISIAAGTDGTGTIDVGEEKTDGYAIDTASALAMVASNDITITGRIRALGENTIDAGDNVLLNGGSLESNGDISIAAGTDGTGSIIGNSSNEVDIISLGTLTLRAPDSIGDGALVVAQVAEKAILVSSSINADISTTPLANPLVLAVSDIGGGQSANVEMNVNSESQVTFDVFNVDVATINANTPTLQVPKGNVTNYAEFVLPTYSTRIDALNRTSNPGYDVNAYTLDGEFSLNALVNSVSLDAFILLQNPNLQVAGDPTGNSEATVQNALNTLPVATDIDPLRLLMGSFGMGDYNKYNREAFVDVDVDWFDMTSQLIPLDDKDNESLN